MRVFISYSHNDNSKVAVIANRLRRPGHHIWIDTVSIRVGDNIPEKLRQGLSEADAILAVISQNSPRFIGVRSELAAAALGQLSRKQQRITTGPATHSTPLHGTLDATADLSVAHLIKPSARRRERRD